VDILDIDQSDLLLSRASTEIVVVCVTLGAIFPSAAPKLPWKV
jgi:hypothetical protein